MNRDDVACAIRRIGRQNDIAERHTTDVSGALMPLPLVADNHRANGGQKVVGFHLVEAETVENEVLKDGVVGRLDVDGLLPSFCIGNGLVENVHVPDADSTDAARRPVALVADAEDVRHVGPKRAIVDR